MNLSVLVINRTTLRAIKVTVAEPPYRLTWIPRACVEDGDSYQAGERDIILVVRGWWAREYEQASWREEMKNENSVG